MEIDMFLLSYCCRCWDTAGQERFKALRTPFYRGSDICLLTYAVNDRDSFRGLKHWREEFIKYADVDGSSFPFIVVGNKVSNLIQLELFRMHLRSSIAKVMTNGSLHFVMQWQCNIGISPKSKGQRFQWYNALSRTLRQCSMKWISIQHFSLCFIQNTHEMISYSKYETNNFAIHK